MVGTPVPALDLKRAEPLLSAAGTRVVLPQDADKAIVLEAIGAPVGTVWRFDAKPSGWLVMLRFPESKEKLKAAFNLATWALPKDDDAFLKELTAK